MQCACVILAMLIQIGLVLAGLTFLPWLLTVIGFGLDIYTLVSACMAQWCIAGLAAQL